ncbi:MAG: RNA polymerase sigma factor [Sporocytophaga sp.]|uniref:RNA polymerase sigma factor n=1 Tax=Sporocytophaga sp. TaxID=2231183 RepID=UPI001B198C87|nr:RNA polymerase sigma factor [Sporocytophaga sp.]MBO9702576.1 RNA polymerase sigma factor [Sporocytophaga sp.]
MEKSDIAKAAKGDLKSFKKIFDYYLPRMRPVCLRYVHTAFEADDVLQEAFVKIFHNIRNFKFEGSFEGWIRRIVVNTALDHFKRNSTYYSHLNIDQINESETESEEINLISDSEPSELVLLVNKLPEGYRMVFNLYVFEDYSHREIAEMLGISEGTSRSQYSKAKNSLKKMITGQRFEVKSTLINRLNSK